jgi:hypothetical protein
MKTQLPITTDEPVTTEQEHRVLQFRPRAVATSPSKSDTSRDQRTSNDAWHEAYDLSRYEQDRPAADDFRHRMLANTAAFAFTVALTAIGIWLAMSLAEMRNTQDCVLMGRRDCARISSQASPHP